LKASLIFTITRKMSAADESSWRRAALTYNDKFVDDYVLHVPGASSARPLRIAQAPSASAALDLLDKTAVGGGAQGTPAATDGDDDAAGADVDKAEDPIPDTAYTIWDAGILLGNYVTQKEVWSRLVGCGEEDGDGDGKVVLELGAGTGVTGLTVAASGLAKVVAMSDLPEVMPFLRHNAARNKHPAGPIRKTTAMGVVPLRWGVQADVDNLPAPLRAPHVILGADLIYTEKTEVIDALVKREREDHPAHSLGDDALRTPTHPTILYVFPQTQSLIHRVAEWWYPKP
jgi:predicted nicotinamide N-methyase